MKLYNVAWTIFRLYVFGLLVLSNPYFTFLPCVQNAGSFYEWVAAGLTSVKIEGFNNGTIDISSYAWSYKVIFFIFQITFSTF